MGIPQYFGWLARKYDSEIVSASTNEIDHFYFDFNCLIYQCYAHLMREKYEELKDKPLDIIQNRLIEEVLKYMKRIIVEVVKPRKSCSICIDGVVPMAKMHQQRLRRYKGPILKEWENDLKRQYGVYKGELMDTNQITPGTPFMDKLSEAIGDGIKSGYFGKLEVSLSDAREFGEGEHKVMAQIRERKHKGERICIYGLDADLIMLSLLLNNEVYLLRENMHLKGMGDSEFLYVRMENLRDLIYQEMMSALSEKANINTGVMDKGRLIKDYVFLGFLLGNDFLHHLPSLSIANNGVDFVINLYATSYGKCKNYLLSVVNNRTRINNGFLKSMFESLSRSEVSNLKFLMQRRRVPNPPNFDDSYSEAKWKWDRIPYNEKFEKCYSVIDYKNSGWKQQYYRLFFDFDVNVENDSVCLEDVCRNYFEGMLFTARYYFDGDVSWYWYNPYYVSPFASDLHEYLKNMQDVNLVKLPNGEPFKPLEQLMMVLPKSSSKFLPDNLAAEMSGSLAMYYPDEFEWVAEERMMLYSIEPKLPLLDIDRIRQVVAENVATI